VSTSAVLQAATTPILGRLPIGDFPAELRERVMWTSAGAVNIA
jgi:hypothetical protein